MLKFFKENMWFEIYQLLSTLTIYCYLVICVELSRNILLSYK